MGETEPFYALDLADEVNKMVFYNGRASTSFFDFRRSPSIVNLTEVEQYFYQLIKGASPSKGLQAFMAGPTYIDCGIACMGGCAQVILNEIGSDKFDLIFSATQNVGEFTIKDVWVDKTPSPLFFQPGPLGSSINPLVHAEPVIPSVLQPGMILHFKNAETYHKRHPGDSGAGFFVTVSEDNERFLAFGLGTLSDGSNDLNQDKISFSEPEIGEMLLNEYNKEPQYFEHIEEKSAKKLEEMVRTSKSKKKLSLKKFQLLGGGARTPFVATLDAERIMALINAPTPEKALDLFRGFRKKMSKRYFINIESR